MKILLFANGSSQNHGCEAIRQTTMELFGGSNYYFVGTTNNNYDKDRTNLKFIPYSFQKTYSIFQRIMCRVGLLKNPKGKLHLEQFRKYFQECDLAISVGGDNYCYEDSDWLYYLHQMAVEYRKPSVLWGASIEEKLITNEMKEDFQKFDRIYVRESISYNSLLNKGLTNCYLCPDPAFILKTQKPDHLQLGYSENKKYIGINISPLVERKEVKKNVIFENIKAIVKYILEKTEYDVLFIPHVVTPDNNDYELLKDYANTLNNSRIVVLDDMPCNELKYYVSKCEFLIAARTHASIAAYSSCVPTLVVGYSVKSRGIALDLFGEVDDYVISVEHIDNNRALFNKFEVLFHRREEIKSFLNKKIPEYTEELYEAVKQVYQNCVGESNE